VATPSIFTSKIPLEDLNQKLTDEQLAGHLGFIFSAITENSVSCQVTIGNIHARPGGIMSGGTTLAMIETLASVAGMMTIDVKSQNIFGIEVNANHVSQVPIGETITGTATPDHLGRTTQIWQVRILNSKQKLVCVGRITLFIAPRN
jgi:1,4-dihydroxy-2-naphthoyl-CoA hydrolase